jgi:beta-N-acetylhexosaminidase
MTEFSTEVIAGQRLMAGFDGTGLNDNLRFLIGTLQVGGLILFSRNLEIPEQISRLCGDCQAYAARSGLPPFFIAIDQEGGQVARLKAPFTRFPGNPAMKNTADAVHFARITAMELNLTGNQHEHGPCAGCRPAKRGQHHGRPRLWQ